MILLEPVTKPPIDLTALKVTEWADYMTPSKGACLAAPHPDFAPEQRLPNARLIAAAPEMYSLLELADELDDTADSDHDARLALEKIGNAARALIAKIKQS